MQYGIRWIEFNKAGGMVKKEKFYNSKEKRDKAAARLEQTESFYRFDAWLN
mgnify:CR=1 FL=1